MSTIAVIPAYNEASHVGDVVKSALDFVDQVVPELQRRGLFASTRAVCFTFRGE